MALFASNIAIVFELADVSHSLESTLCAQLKVLKYINL